MAWIGSDDETKDNNVPVVDHTSDLSAIWILLLIIAVVEVLQYMLKFYSEHNNRLKKRYISRGNDLNKI
ncbi:hypothetical protein KR074_004202 [Drosophila pseudoananassae]|nr:hypothetical protein KR074_004202 [Drosophila pseudoananassae]